MGIGDFLSRHRNKILLVGGAAGAVVVMNKILAKYEKQWESSSSRNFVHEARKKEIHFENIISECNQLCQRMSPKIVTRLQELLDDSKLIDDLAAKRGQDKNTNDKVEIWKLLKVFAKNAADNMAGSSSATVADLAHMKAYTKYYAFLGSFYDQRFDCLIQPIEEAVDQALGGYSIDYRISIQDFRVILDKIKRSMSFHLSSPTSKTKVFFLDAEKLSTIDLSSVCPDSGPLTKDEEDMLRSMLAETQDIFESEDFKHVLESSIEVGYAILLDNLLGSFIKMESNNRETSSNFSNPNAIQVPLVKILPQIRNSYLKRKESDQKALVNHLLCLDVLNCFAANVYEAFCALK